MLYLCYTKFVLPNAINSKSVTYEQTLDNVSLQEMALAFDYTVHQKTIQYMVLPVFMDDLREDGIRQDISFDTLRLTGYRIEGDTLAFPVIRKINRDLYSAKPAEQSNKDIAGLSETTQERVELWLNHQLEEYSTAWKNRPRLRGEFFTLLYSLRNTALGINAQTKRKMIPQRYNNNFEALKYILSTSEKRGIAVLLYIPPIRQDVEVPYSTEEYANFKKDVVALCSVHPRTVTVLNLETIVPGEYWGVKSATTLGAKPELDFMHFQYEGHRLLFQHLYPPVLRMTRS